MVIEDFQGRVAIVTGGASGIGRGIATRLIARGTKVVLADVEERALAATADEIGAFGVRTDVTSLSDMQRLADAALERFGKIDIVCNNAGIGPMAAIADMTMADWHWLIDVNLYGVIHGVQTFLPILKGNPDTTFILNTASIAGLAAGLPGLGGYAVTKFGIVALTEALAAELAMANSSVGAGVLLPGTVRSNIGKSKRNQPDGVEGSALVDVELDDVPHLFEGGIPWMTAEDAGEIAVEGIKAGKLYIATHPGMFPPIGERHTAIAAAFAV